MDSQPLKKQKAAIIPSSVISIFSSVDGTRAGPPIDLPVATSSNQLEQLINNLLGSSEVVPYAFYVEGIEVTSSVEATLAQLQEEGKCLSYEDTLTISYQPLSVYRVRPVTRCVESMPGHTDSVLHVSYSPNGSCLASGGGDMTVRFWNPSTSLPAHTCIGHRDHVLCTAWAPNGLRFLSADRAGEIRQWDPKTGSQIGAPLKGHKKWVTSLAYEPLHSNAECNRVASSSKDHTVRIWNLSTMNCEGIISGHTDSVETVKWGGNGLIYTASRDRTIMVWAIDGHGRSQHKLVRTLSGHAHRINTLALNVDYVLRTGYYQLGISAAPNSPQEAQQLALERYQAVTAGDGERLVSGSDDYTLYMWNPQQGKAPITRMTGHQQLVNCIAFSPDARFIASASFDKKVKLWCGKTGRFIATYNGHVSAVYQVAWSADSNFVVSASKDSTLKLWSVKNTKKAEYTLPGHEDEVYALDWSPDGTQVASGSKDRTIKVWRH